MKINTFIAASSIALAGFFMPAASFAQPLTLKLPQETAKLKPSKLPGYQVAMQKCAICHSADYINQQPPGMNQAQWTAEVRKMEHAYAAPLSDAEVNQIGEYLAVTYGTAKAPAPVAVAAATPAAAPLAAAGGAIDVQALLTANACLGCHAIHQKIVGPSYHDVAMKYKGDAQAQGKLEASIRAGGAGKWGQVPMPAFAGLKPPEVQALAAFVLKQ
ncbi:MAG: c-type cytochrome [Pseudomonadota bacterium]